MWNFIVQHYVIIGTVLAYVAHAVVTSLPAKRADFDWYEVMYQSISKLANAAPLPPLLRVPIPNAQPPAPTTGGR